MIPRGKKKIKIGGGSAFITHPSGIILTNRHVIADPQNGLGTFRNTVSVGVISGLSREIIAGDAATKKTTKLWGLIQNN